MFGYDVGVISGAKVQVAHEMELTCGQEEAVVSKPFQSINSPPPLTTHPPKRDIIFLLFWTYCITEST